MVHQMKVETCGAYIGATNPYTGQALNHWLPRGNRWGKTYIHTDDEEEEKEDDYDVCGNDRKDYGMGWYDCNTDWQSWNRR